MLTVADLMLILLEVEPEKIVEIGCSTGANQAFYSTAIDVYRESPVPLNGEKKLFLLFGREPQREFVAGSLIPPKRPARPSRRSRR